MMNYICLLRGINVSGQKLIKMTELVDMFEKTGYSRASSYIQSGNILFASDNTNISAVTTDIENQILRSFGFEVAAFVYTSSMWEKFVSHNPFTKHSDVDKSSLYITLSRSVFSVDKETSLQQKCMAGELFSMSDNILYTCYPNGYGKSKLTNNVIEAVFKTTATTRNWKTTLELTDRIRKM